MGGGQPQDGQETNFNAAMPVLTVYEVLKEKGLRSKHEQLEVADPVAPGVD